MALRKSFNTTDIEYQDNTPGQAPAAHASQEGALIPASQIHPSPFNEGIAMPNVEQYAKSMQEVGLLEPITLYERGPGDYEILTGHQRFEAWCRVLGHKDIRANIRPYEPDPKKRFTAHSHANTQFREKDLSYWTSRINWANKVLNDANFKGGKTERLREICKMIGMSQAMYYRYSNFVKISKELQSLESEKILSVSTLYAAVSLDEAQQHDVYVRVLSLMERKKEKVPEEFRDSVEVTREEFDRIVAAVKVGAPDKKESRKKSGYGERVDRAFSGFIKTLSGTKSKADREEAIACIQRLREKLDELEAEMK